MKTDLIIGMATNYSWQDMQPWVVSLWQTGYTGRAILITGNAPGEPVGDAPGYKLGDYAHKWHITPTDASKDPNALRNKLAEFGVELVNIGQISHHPSVERGRVIADVIDATPDLRFVIVSDVKDVAFQSNPIPWLEANLGDFAIAVQSEGNLYRECGGNGKNMREAFGQEAFDAMANEYIMNAGVICGLPGPVADLSRAVYHKSKQDLRLAQFVPTYKDMLADQSALNLLLREPQWKDKTLFSPMDSNFISENSHTCARKVIAGVVYPGNSRVPYAMFHQFCVNGDWWVAVKERYKVE